MAEVLLTINNKCLQCHSNRPTAKEVYRICYNVCFDMKFSQVFAIITEVILIFYLGRLFVSNSFNYG